MRENVPLADLPDADMERTYYFRWWAYRKHIRRAPAGFVISEFQDDVPWAGKAQYQRPCHHPQCCNNSFINRALRTYLLTLRVVPRTLVLPLKGLDPDKPTGLDAYIQL